MPILKTEILGSEIEINFEENERKKLLHLVEVFKKRLNEFDIINGRTSNTTILFLAGLKIEDELNEAKNLVNKNTMNEIELAEQKNIIDRLKKETIFLKDKIKELNDFNLSKESSKSSVIEEINKLENIIKNIHNKILSKNNDGY